MRRKGRLCLGAVRLTSPPTLATIALARDSDSRCRRAQDADIVVFDPGTVKDCATWTEPALKSEGVAHVLVHGVSVVADGVFVAGATAGRPVHGERGEGGDPEKRATKRFRTTGLYSAILEAQDSTFLASPSGSL